MPIIGLLVGRWREIRSTKHEASATRNAPPGWFRQRLAVKGGPGRQWLVVSRERSSINQFTKRLGFGAQCRDLNRPSTFGQA